MFTDIEKARILRRMRMLEELVFGRATADGDVIGGTGEVVLFDAAGNEIERRTYDEAPPRKWDDVV